MARTGPTPFGYKRNGNHLCADQLEAPVRRRVFELFEIHKKKAIVAQELNYEGHRTRSNTIFSAQTIGRILNRDIVLGRDANTDQIVDEALFQRCQNILADQTARGGAKRGTRYLLAGMLWCEPCGQKMYVPSNSKKYVCESCKAKITIRDLDTIIAQHLRNSDQPAIAKLMHKWDRLDTHTRRELVELVITKIELLPDYQLRIVQPG